MGVQFLRINQLSAVLALLLLLTFEVSHGADCNPVAEVLSAEGEVRFTRPESSWEPVEVGQQLCQADTISTAKKGRAALRLVNQTLVRMDRDTTLVLTDIQPRKKSLLDLLSGVIHAISRTPRKLNVNTPFVNAAIEGTEFVIAANDRRSKVTVLEGKVVATNKLGQSEITTNQATITRPHHAPEAARKINPSQAITWALYYPRIVDSATFSPASSPTLQSLGSVMDYLQSNHALAACHQLQQIPAEAQDAHYHTLAAATDLRLGAVDNADKHLHLALQKSVGFTAPYALQALIRVVQGKLSEAEAVINKADQINPGSPLLKLADSYLSQARFNIPLALELATDASRLAPESPIAKARMAELLLMSGDTAAAEQAAYAAALLEPNIAEYQTVLGFTSLRHVRLAAAEHAFDLAIKLDSSAPLPRLGKGLVQIRQNDLEAGRDALEIAVLLDPGNSLLRSYLGKAYTEERRHSLAMEQFKLAKHADPNDPTPWFYNAILLQSLNQPVKALGQHLGAMQRNDNRGVYRSRQLLDQDAAARIVALGRAYNDLGFQQQAKSQAGNALQIDPGDSSAHRLLADSYLDQANLNAARKSELLQAQLLQPLNLTTTQPRLASSNLGLLDGTGPKNLSFNEYNSMFIRNGLFGQINATVGGQGSRANDVIVSSLSDRWALSLGQHHSETRGPRENADFKTDIYSLFAQFAASDSTLLQFETQREARSKGDALQRFFPEIMNSATLRLDLKNTSYRLGVNHQFNRQSRLLGSAIHTDAETSSHTTPTEPVPTFQFSDTGTNINLLDLQFLHQAKRFYVTTGAAVASRKGQSRFRLQSGATSPADEATVLKQSNANIDEIQNRIYAYVYHRPIPNLKTVYGLSIIHDDSELLGSTHSLAPKLGMLYAPKEGYNLRFAAYKTVSAPLAISAYHTLEPTQIAGFNQIFDESTQTEATNLAVGIDATLSPQFTFGLEMVSREVTSPTVIHGTTEASLTYFSRHERIASAYANLVLNEQFSLSAKYQLEETEQDTRFDFGELSNLAPDSVLNLKTHRVPLALSWFHPSGLSLQLHQTYFDQTGVFLPGTLDTKPLSGQDHFWITDLSASFRWKKFPGKITVGVNNLMDRHFSYEDRNTYDALNTAITGQPSQLATEQQIFGSLTMSFR